MEIDLDANTRRIAGQHNGHILQPDIEYVLSIEVPT